MLLSGFPRIFRLPAGRGRRSRAFGAENGTRDQPAMVGTRGLALPDVWRDRKWRDRGPGVAASPSPQPGMGSDHDPHLWRMACPCGTKEIGSKPLDDPKPSFLKVCLALPSAERFPGAFVCIASRGPAGREPPRLSAVGIQHGQQAHHFKLARRGQAFDLPDALWLKPERPGMLTVA